MATRDDVRTDVDTLIGTDPQLSDAEMNTLIQLRYEQLYDGFTWSRKLRDFTLRLIPQLSSTSSTLATATVDSSTVTFAGSPITSAYDGFAIAVDGDVQYFFLSRTDSSTITLQNGEGTSVNWVAATGGSKTWRVFKTIFTLPTDADSVWSLAGQSELTELDGGRPALDRVDPYRSSTAADPTDYVMAGVNSSNVREVEIWPVPTQARLLRGQYTRTAPTLAASTTIDIPRALLVYATAADCLNMLHAKTGDAAYASLGLFYESKAKNVEREIKPIELERLSPPTSLRRAQSAAGRFRGTDFEVSHDLDAGDR